MPTEEERFASAASLAHQKPEREVGMNPPLTDERLQEIESVMWDDRMRGNLRADQYRNFVLLHSEIRRCWAAIEALKAGAISGTPEGAKSNQERERNAARSAMGRTEHALDQVRRRQYVNGLAALNEAERFTLQALDAVLKEAPMLREE